MTPDKVFAEPLSITIGGQEWKMNRVTIADISAIYARIRDNRLASILRMQNGMSEHSLGVALARAAAMDPTEEDYWQFLKTPSGIVYLFWRCMSPHHPRLTEQHIAAMLESEEGDALKSLLLNESGMVEPLPEAEPREENPENPFPVFGSGEPLGPKNGSS